MVICRMIGKEKNTEISRSKINNSELQEEWHGSIYSSGSQTL